MQTSDHTKLLLNLKGQDERYQCLKVDLENGRGDPFVVSYLMLQYGSKALKPLVKGLSCPVIEMRMQCIECLVKLGDFRAVNPMIQMFSDTANESLFFDIREAIGQLCIWENMEPVYEALHSQNPEIRSNIAGVLFDYGDEKIFTLLLAALQDPDIKVFENVCNAIEAWSVYKHNREIASAALAAYLFDPDPTKRTAAASALGNAGNLGSALSLIHAIGTFNSDKVFHIKVAESLVKISEEYENESLNQKLNDLLEKNHFLGKEVLTRSMFPEVEEPQPSVPENQAEPEITITKTFTNLPEPDESPWKPLGILIEQLNDPDPQKRIEAAESLGERANRKATMELCLTLSDNNPEVQLAAIKALGKIGDKRATSAFNFFLPRKTCYHREEMAEAMSRLHDRRSVPVLAKVFITAWLELKAAIVMSLGNLGGPSTLKPLITALGDSHPKIRYIAVWKLRDLQHPRALKALKQALIREKNKHVREQMEGVLTNYYLH